MPGEKQKPPGGGFAAHAGAREQWIHYARHKAAVKGDGATSTRRLLSYAIGSGQEIHVGEEAGLGQWRTALEKAADPGGWTVHAPQTVLQEFFGPRAAPHSTSGSTPHSASSTHPAPLRQAASPALELTVELRFHFADDLDRWVDGLLSDDRDWPDGEHTARNAALAAEGQELASRLEHDGYHLRMTRDLEVAKSYLRRRYLENPDARYGLVASSRDKVLEPDWGVPNGWRDAAVIFVPPDSRLDATAASLQGHGVKVLGPREHSTVPTS